MVAAMLYGIYSIVNFSMRNRPKTSRSGKKVRGFDPGIDKFC